MTALARPQPEAAEVLTKAAGRAAELLGLNGATLARVLGSSEAGVSRLLRGQRHVKPESKEGEMAALLIRLYRSLDALVGNDAERRRAWMHSHNTALGGIPAELIRSAQGLVTTVAYLDGMRAPL